MSGLRVLVVDDSPICRELLRELLEAEGDIRVVGEAESGPDLLARVAAVAPDLVTMDVRMPGMSGLEALELLMAQHPCPVLVVTDAPSGPTESLAFEATRRGALDLLRKPATDDVAAASALRERVRLLARVPVIRHLGARASSPTPNHSSPTMLRPATIVGLGASVGGPAALATVLAQVPADATATFAVVQHIPPGFASAFARFLSERTPLRVVIANRPTPLEPGLVVLPPDDRHLVAHARVLEASDAAPESSLRPSVDVLFRSLARAHGARAMGVLLTGIGRDGVDGLSAMRRAGAETIAEDESTARVWGMPRAAIEAGAAARVLPLPSIARAVAARARALGGAR